MSMLWLQGLDQFAAVTPTTSTSLKNTYAALWGFSEWTGYGGPDQVRLGISDTVFRVAGASMRLQQTSSDNLRTGVNAVRKAFPNNDPVVVFGLAFLVDAANYSLTEPVVFMGNAPGGGVYRNNVVVGYSTSGSVVLYTGAQWPNINNNTSGVSALTPVAASEVGVVSAGSWNYMEVKVDYGQTTNTVSVYVANELVLTHAAAAFSYDTNNSKDPITSIAVAKSNGGFSITGSSYFDDMYLLNGEGSVNNDVIGPQRVAVYPVNGAGASAEWTVTGAPTNHEAVDDPIYDETDTSFVQSTALNQQDYYTLTDAEEGFTAINAVQLGVFARTDTGTANLRLKAAEGGQEIFDDGAVGSSAFSEVTAVFDTDPSGNPWTEAVFNSMQIGIENV